MHSSKICVLLYRSSRLEVFFKNCALKIWQNSQKKTCVGIFLLKKWLQSKCFPVSFLKFLRTYISKSTSGDCFSLWDINDLIDVFKFSTLTKLKLKSDFHFPKNILQWKLFKNDEKWFLFHFKSSSPSQHT